MSRYDYKPNPRIVARAANLWIGLLSNPKYDNLGANSPEPLGSVRVNRMASIMTSLLPKNNTQDVLQRFGKELEKILLAPYEWQSEWNGKKETHVSIFRELSVDYHPDVALSSAAKAAGLEMKFPWKTSMWIDEQWLSLSCGYGAPTVYHYPLTNGRWLTAKLSGDDMLKIIALVESGEIGLRWEGINGSL